MKRFAFAPLPLVTAALLSGCGEYDPPPAAISFPLDVPILTAADLAGDSAAYLAVLSAEDRRAPTPDDLTTLLYALADPVDGVARAAARALGRLERPEVVEPLLGVVADETAADATRAEAANAVAQAVRGADAGARRTAVAALLTRLRDEPATLVGAAVARSVGRIPPGDDLQAAEVASALAGWDPTTEEAPAGRLGLARAAFFHVRVTARGYPTYDPALLLPLLERLHADGDPAVRRAAAATSRSIGRPPSVAEWERLIGDPDPGVRREGVLWAGTRSHDVPELQRLDWLAAGLDDPSAEVRIAAVQGWAAWGRDAVGCAPLIVAATAEAGLADPGDAVSLAAIASLRPSCVDAPAAQAALVSIAGRLADDPSAWHRPAAALISLAEFDAVEAETALPGFVDHANPFARTAAATVAGRLGAVDVLRRLAADPDANVREAALLAWGADAPTTIFLAQLERAEPQLLRAVAALLEPRTGPTLAPALLNALDRSSNPVRATMRDARVALLRRAGELGTPALLPRVEPYLTDPDPAIAALAASILTRWSGSEDTAAPTGLGSLPLPSFAELAALEDSVAVVTMASGDTFTIATLPFEAPTNAFRFMRMARAGDFGGLTWHRVVANFVVQGGSPFANEYAGHGFYSRDEIGLVGHFAGTLGISTRGRDTGDGQPFFNLVDNLRLDHDYTVFGYLIDGLDAIRRVRAGDVIERIEIRAR